MATRYLTGIPVGNFIDLTTHASVDPALVAGESYSGQTVGNSNIIMVESETEPTAGAKGVVFAPEALPLNFSFDGASKIWVRAIHNTGTLVINDAFGGSSISGGTSIDPRSTGSELDSFWATADTTGAWDIVELPAGVDARAVLIQVHDGDADNFASNLNPAGFKHSSNSDGAGWTNHTELVVSIRKTSGNLGYVRAAAGQKIAVKVLS